MMIVSLIFLISFSGALQAKITEEKDILLGDSGYVIRVPVEWKTLPPRDDGAMKVHIRVHHDNGCYSDFDVFELDRGALSRQDWYDYYLREYLPSVYANFRVESEEEIIVGSHEGRLFHVLDLKNKKGFGLLEAIVYAKDKVIFLRYLYSLKGGADFRKQLSGILDSFSDSEEARKRAREWYQEGLTLGLEKFGLFLRLPAEWIPDREGIRQNDVTVSLPSGGTLRVIAFRRVFSEIEGLKELIEKRVQGVEPIAEVEPTVFGVESRGAFLFEQKNSDGAPLLRCIFGLHGRGGYALVLKSDNSSESDLLEKIALKSVLVEPHEITTLRRRAVADFKAAMRENNAAMVRNALTTLILFAENKDIVRIVSSGLKANEEIQVECAIALGKMGSAPASSVLKTTMTKGLVSDRVKKACAEALDQSSGGF